MIADNCELTLVTTQAFNGKSYLALALNGEVIPHQKHLSVTTDRMGYDEVNVTFVLAPKREEADSEDSNKNTAKISNVKPKKADLTFDNLIWLARKLHDNDIVIAR